MILIFAFLLPIFSTVQTSINIFLSPIEVQRLLGVNAEVKYVADGKLNAYALRFPLRVKQNISEVVFSWNSEGLSRKVAYLIHTIFDDGVLPIVRAPRNGFIPSKTEDFVVEYRCSKAGQFVVELHVNISYPSIINRTYVVLKQQKLCCSHEKHLFKGLDRDGLRIHGDQKGVALTGEDVFYMVIICVLAVVLVIVVLLIIYFKSNRKQIPNYQFNECDIDRTLHQRRMRNVPSLCGVVDSEVSFLLHPNEHRNDSCPLPVNRLSVFPQLIHEKPYVIDIASTLNELHVDKKFLEVLPVHEVEGTFGELKWAIWRKKCESKVSNMSSDEENDCIDEVLLVKALKTTADLRQLNIFLEQSLRFHHIPRFTHLAQVDAAAFCGLYDSREKSVDFPLICYKHQGYGNLKRFLQRCRSGITEDVHKTAMSNSVQTLRTHELVSMGIQILKAVLHLHKYSTIHKDIASRNCLVSEVGQSPDRFFVQLCDAALSKDLFPNDYHCLGDNDNRPVKWMAYESLRSNLYNSSTDAWSFGVTLWELLSCGQQPYLDVDPDEIICILQQGHRLPQPYNCPDELYDVMYCCWQLDYRDRPTCDQLLTTLQNFMIQLRQFI